jgi:hypothetical protein
MGDGPHTPALARPYDTQKEEGGMRQMDIVRQTGDGLAGTLLRLPSDGCCMGRTLLRPFWLAPAARSWLAEH